MDVRRRSYGIEWPTLALILATYAIWGVLVAMGGEAIPLWLAIPALAVTLTLHSSLQHEVMHGHPFPNRMLSEAMMTPGLGLVIPFGRFRDLHLAHHKDANLTDPYDDPESHYFDPEHYSSLSRWTQLLLRINNTLLGRLVVGPTVGLEGFLRTEIQLIRAGSGVVIRQWALHGLTLVPILLAITLGAMPLWGYLLAGYCALSILKIRTFVEHQAHQLTSGRTVIIEDRGPLAFLFLNNNLHSVHHTHPAVAWYDLPALYHARREAYLARNRGYFFPSYWSVAKRYFFRPKEPVPHPLANRRP